MAYLLNRQKYMTELRVDQLACECLIYGCSVLVIQVFIMYYKNVLECTTVELIFRIV